MMGTYVDWERRCVFRACARLMWSCSLSHARLLMIQTSDCGEKVIYISENAPGGCQQTCSHPENRNFYGTFDADTTCSDGGQGSFRVPFLQPYGVLDLPVIYWEFACDFGTQVLVLINFYTHPRNTDRVLLPLAVQRLRSSRAEPHSRSRGRTSAPYGTP